MEFEIDVFDTSSEVSPGLYSAQITRGERDIVASKTQVRSAGTISGRDFYEGTCTVSQFEEQVKQPEGEERAGEEYNYHLEINENHRLSFVESDLEEEPKTTMMRVDESEIEFYIIGGKAYVQRTDSSYNPIFESLNVDYTQASVSNLTVDSQMEATEEDPFMLDEDAGPEQEMELAGANGVEDIQAGGTDVYRSENSDTVVVTGVESLRDAVVEVWGSLEN